MSLLILGLVAVAGLWVAWKVVKFTVKLAVVGGVAALIYFVLLPRVLGMT